MASLLEIHEQFAGRGAELNLGPTGLALTHRGLVPSDPRFQVAGYDLVKDAELDARGRRLTVTFTDARPAWTLDAMHPAEAAWAQVLVLEAGRRSRLYAEPGFRACLSDEALRQTLTDYAALEPSAVTVAGDLLLTQAALQRATDIHLQPAADHTAVSFRVDGCLRQVARLDPDLAGRVVARFKVRAGMQSYRRNLAQTGGGGLPLGDRVVDLRFTCLPTLYGEKLTIRLFDPAQALLDLTTLGMEPEVLATYQELLVSPQGTLLLTGPSGSGKTTTLYASLAYLLAQDSDRSVATVEEPVELPLAGVDQTPVNRGVGLDFAAGLRTILRQDPQVLMVGEIRDAETAGAAIQAGLTGHLVFSTVHAPSAAGVFARLTQLGVEPYLVASSVSAVLAQRLVRRACPECRSGQPGCPACQGTGFSGRTGLFSLLPVTTRLRDALLACRPLGELEQIAAEEGRGSLWDAAKAKLRAGLTTEAEVRRVLGRRPAP
jgi:general secretion pathway protein E